MSHDPPPSLEHSDDTSRVRGEIYFGLLDHIPWLFRFSNPHTSGGELVKPVDLQSARTARSEQKIKALEDAKAALQKHHDHMRTHYAELSEYLAVVDEQLQMADTAMEAIDAQLLIHRSGA